VSVPPRIYFLPEKAELLVRGQKTAGEMLLSQNQKVWKREID
jgi:hypothetical protein